MASHKEKQLFRRFVSLRIIKMTEMNLFEKIKMLEEENMKLKEYFAKIIATNPSGIAEQDVKGYIAHRGIPPGLHECSRCRENKDTTCFNYYNQRVDKNGYLMRSNALCKDCGVETDKERKETLKKAGKEGKIPPKPAPGDVCKYCNRNWGSKEQPRNWHRDHDAIKNEFRGWLCGDCNMAKHDHRHGIS